MDPLLILGHTKENCNSLCVAEPRHPFPKIVRRFLKFKLSYISTAVQTHSRIFEDKLAT